MTQAEWIEALDLFIADKTVSDSTRYNYVRLLLHFWNSYGKHITEHEPLRLEHVSQYIDKIKSSQVATFKSAFRKFTELYHSRTGKCAHLLDITQMHPVATEIAMLVEAFGSAQKLMYAAIDRNLTDYPPSVTMGLDYFPDRPQMFAEALTKVISWGYPNRPPQLGDPLLVEEPAGRVAMNRAVILKIMKRSGYDFKFITKHGYFFAKTPTGQKIKIDGIEYDVVKSLYKHELETNTRGRAQKEWQQMLERSKRAPIDHADENTELCMEGGKFTFRKPTFVASADSQEPLVQQHQPFAEPTPLPAPVPMQPPAAQVQPQGSGFNVVFTMPPEPEPLPVQMPIPVPQMPAPTPPPQRPMQDAGYRPPDYTISPEAEQRLQAMQAAVDAFDPLAPKNPQLDQMPMEDVATMLQRWQGRAIAERQQAAAESAAFDAAQEAAGTAAIDREQK